MNHPLARAAPDPWPAIRADFGYSETEDARAAAGLAKLLARPPFAPDSVWESARAILAGRPALVAGAADAAEVEIRQAPADWPLVAADGATTAALEAGRTPDLIVTDLDGEVDDQVRAAEAGALVFVHAHGDNAAAVERWVARFPAARVAGTCQVVDVPPVRQVGGFTDGDRAAHLARALGATRARLAGFRLQGPVGHYSGAKDRTTKLRKLAWAQELLARLQSEGFLIERP